MWILGKEKLSAIAIIGIVLVVSACQARFRVQANVPEAQSPPQLSDSLQSQIDLRSRWIVSPSEAQDFAHKGATILDVRSRRRTDIPGAALITWQQFSRTQKPHHGNLKISDAALTQDLQSLGISAQIPVLVVGEAQSGWGEEGRIVWMLRTLGHPQAYMVDGGAPSLKPFQPQTSRVATGDFIVQRDSRWTIAQSELKQQLKTGNLNIIDSREPREYQGKTPYGETRGGHLANAKNLYFKDLLGPNGKLLPYEALIAKLNSLGITTTDPIVVYCTGGIRSGWLTTVLVSLGYQARNYPGSMWEWSASPEAQYPLFKSSSSGDIQDSSGG